MKDESPVTTTSVSGELMIAPLEKGDEELFVSLYETSVRPFYDRDTLDYSQWVLKTHFCGSDPYGYFTRRKTIWILYESRRPTGFLVATEKRGGSVKFGPTALVPGKRGRGLGTKFRLLAEQKYPHARKFYNTLPESNSSALRYILNAGYRIEAHLERQYSLEGEIVVGKLAVPKSSSPVSPMGIPVNMNASLSVLNGRDLTLSQLEAAALKLLPDWYSEIDRDFVIGLFSGIQDRLDFSRKSKSVAVAFRAHEPVGLIVVTPKRGGALKCSPLVTTGDDDCFRSLIHFASANSERFSSHKEYLHLPLTDSRLITESLTLGFKPEGILIEPYKQGIDMLVLARMIR